jgi:hypothetical protein
MTALIDAAAFPPVPYERSTISSEPDLDLGASDPDPFQLINERRLEAENAEALRLARAL